MTIDKQGLKREWQLIAKVWHLSQGCHLVMLIAMVLQIVIGFFPAGITYYVQKMASGSVQIAQLLTKETLLPILALTFVSILIKQMATILQGYAMADVKKVIDNLFIRNFSLQDYSYVRDNMDNRNMMAISRESDMMTGLIPMIYRSFIQAPITILAFLILMLVISARLTLTVMLLIMVVVVCSLVLRSLLKKINHQLYSRMGDLHQMFAEWLRGYKVYLFYDSKGYLAGRMSKVVGDMCGMQKRLVNINSFQTVIIEVLTYVVVIVFLFIVSDMHGDMRWQTLVSFPTAILFIRNEAIKISRGYMQLSGTESAVKHLWHIIFDPVADNRVKTNRIEWNEKIVEIRLDGVSFSYGSNMILKNATACFRPEGMHVIAGRSGMGKTTTFDIMASMRIPQSGRVLYNGKDIGLYTMPSLMMHMAFVEQEPFIFEGTFKENLTFGNEAEDDDILNLCHAMRLNHIITEKADLDKRVGADGHNLSSGEKQRISFIRALLKRPDVLLLDEFTSNVDHETSSVMLGYLASIADDIIVICISHDPDVIGQSKHVLSLTDKRFV